MKKINYVILEEFNLDNQENIKEQFNKKYYEYIKKQENRKN